MPGLFLWVLRWVGGYGWHVILIPHKDQHLFIHHWLCLLCHWNPQCPHGHRVLNIQSPTSSIVLKVEESILHRQGLAGGNRPQQSGLHSDGHLWSWSSVLCSWPDSPCKKSLPHALGTMNLITPCQPQQTELPLETMSQNKPSLSHVISWVSFHVDLCALASEDVCVLCVHIC